MSAAAPRWVPAIWLTFACATGVTITASSLTGVVLTATALLIGVLLTVRAVRPATARTPSASRASLWERQLGVLRQRDPDAAGRSRPRAPTLAPQAV
jgi:hypothetical protein